MTLKIGGPIPGESLTREPGNAPWEQPPKFAKVEEALAWHLENFERGDVLEDTLFLLDQGMPLSTYVDSLTTYAVMQGYHTIDVSTLISPVIHQYLKEAANAGDINLKEWDGPPPEEVQKQKDKQRISLMLPKAFKPDFNASTPAPTTTPSPTTIKEKPIGVPEAPAVEKSGLIPRRK